MVKPRGKVKRGGFRPGGVAKRRAPGSRAERVTLAWPFIHLFGQKEE
jgi:hypothetical protein